MLSNLFAFAVTFIAAWLNMAVVKIILHTWLDDEKSTLAAFAFSVGSLTGLGRFNFHDNDTIGVLAGVILAYVGLWWVHFGRARWEKAHR
jgi:hypothetical protein